MKVFPQVFHTLCVLVGYLVTIVGGFIWAGTMVASIKSALPLEWKVNIVCLIVVAVVVGIIWAIHYETSKPADPNAPVDHT